MQDTLYSPLHNDAETRFGRVDFFTLQNRTRELLRMNMEIHIFVLFFLWRIDLQAGGVRRRPGVGLTKAEDDGAMTRWTG